MCRQRRKQGKLKSNGTQAKRRCACSTSTWAASGCPRGDRVKDKHNTAFSHSRYFKSSKSSSPPYRIQPIAALETKPALPARLNRPLQTDRLPSPSASIRNTATNHSDHVRSLRTRKVQSSLSHTLRNHQLIPSNQAKQRLPRLPASQSLAAALRDRRHLRQCARPACHRQHLRVLLKHDDQYQRQCAKAGSDGEPGKQSRRIQIGGNHHCDGRGALVDIELVLVRD